MVFATKNDNRYTNNVLHRLGFRWSDTAWDYVERMLSAFNFRPSTLSIPMIYGLIKEIEGKEHQLRFICPKPFGTFIGKQGYKFRVVCL